MSNLETEIANAQAKLERLKARKRRTEERNRRRLAEALVSIIDGIEDADSVSVRALVDQAKAKIKEEDDKRRAASKKAAAKRRAATQVESEANDAEQGNERNDETDNQPFGGGYRVDS